MIGNFSETADNTQQAILNERAVMYFVSFPEYFYGKKRINLLNLCCPLV